MAAHRGARSRGPASPAGWFLVRARSEGFLARAMVLFALAVVAGLAAPPALAATAVPAGGGGFTVALAASAYWQVPGRPVTLTATANADVGPTPYYISIYDETSGTEVALCGFGTTCSAVVTSGTRATHTYQAYIGDDVDAGSAPGFVLVSSAPVSVTWMYIRIRFRS